MSFPRLNYTRVSRATALVSLPYVSLSIFTVSYSKDHYSFLCILSSILFLCVTGPEIQILVASSLFYFL
jgi:hypothetical protein